MEKKIKCKHCESDIGIKNFARHLKSKHDVVYLDYITENLEEFHQFGWNKCPYTEKVLKGKCDPKYLNQFLSDTTKGISKGPMSEETKMKLSEGRKGKKHWNYGKKRDFMTDEIRAKIGKANKENYSIPENSPFWGKTHPESVRKKISKSQIEWHEAHEHPFKGKKHKPESIKKMFAYREERMNKLEKMVDDRLEELGVKRHFQFFIVKDKTCKIYDFKIKGKPAIIEVDGDYWHGNPNTKSHCKEVNEVRENDQLKNEIAESRGYKVYRLWETDIKNDISVVDDVVNQILS